MSEAHINIILVDDHQVVLDGLKVLLMVEPEIKVIATAGESESLFRVLEDHLPDVLVLDLVLPGLNGVEITRRLQESHPDIAIIIFSGNSPDDLLLEAIDAGALGILSKNAAQEELVQAIRAVHQGETHFGSHISPALLRNYIGRQRTIARDQDAVSKLSEREIEIIRLFADGKSYKEIAAELHISTHTVESHKNNVLKKIEARTIIDMVKFGIKHGLVEL